MASAENNIINHFPLFDVAEYPETDLNHDLFTVSITYLDEPPELPFYTTWMNFEVNHNNNPWHKSFIINTINNALDSYKDTYNETLSTEMTRLTKNCDSMESYFNLCDAPKITDVVVTQSHSYNWLVTSHHERPERSEDMSEDTYNRILTTITCRNKFEINIYTTSETTYLIEFHNHTDLIQAYMGLYKEVRKEIEKGHIQNRLPFLHLYTLYNNDTEIQSQPQSQQFNSHIERYLFNKYIGMEICSYL